MSYEYLTYEALVNKCKELYPELWWSNSDVDNLIRIEAKLDRLSRCDDLTENERWKVDVLLPNVRECLQ